MIKIINILKSIGLLALLIFSLSNCKDNDGCKPKDECQDFPELDGGGIIGPIKQKPNQRKAPCFNPNNGDEFVYIRYENNIQSLVRSNLITGEEEVLLENVSIVGQPHWGKEIIIYSNISLKVQLLNIPSKYNNQITHIFESNFPKIFRDSLVLLTVFTETVPGASGLKLINFKGNRLDSIQIGDLKGFNAASGKFSCSNNYVFAEFGTESNYGVYQINFGGRELEALSIKTFDGTNKIVGISNHFDDFVIYSTYRTGIFKVEVASKKETCIKSACDTRSYRFLSVSPDGTKLLAERVDATDFIKESGGWTEESKIVLMNVDGSNERVLFE